MIDEPICAVPWTAWAGSLYIPIGVILSNGGVVKVVPTDEYFPIRKTVIFTSSQDNQTTVAIQLCRGTEPVDKVKLEGLLPRPKGRARVKVEINIRDWNDITATVQEVGTDLKKIKAFGENIIWEPGCIRTHEQTTIEMVEMTLGEDGVIGELPE
ncbi:hypothetical protein CPB86DRAFT_877996 [Serendipita vermifera]|nr:hypothetical protein CPB86DRAFT_877996 [Serendipita vermifera]